MARNSRRVVPVVNRSTRKNRAKVALPKVKLSVRELIILGVVSIIVLFLIFSPLRNHLQQKAEIARVSAAIERKEEQKKQLIEQIEKYQSEAYIREQARTQLGVIAPGETAFRVIEPPQAQNQDQKVGTEHADATQPWYELLWDSVTVPEKHQPQEETATEPMNLPIMPTETP
ncbi:septum formation initiator family protein [Corynebacterium sp. sy017]|uniref:FtsB family cell division protein n=1 Tax=unclassified Corynebacterium TaxID=2624378 RepID=UPI0011862DFC|nr:MULTISPECIES: septum formation initiator family protein [unclassified Corynebacterium]MBP3088896.1 septum formation initiator family protein [Corynebacterium sp. sy017]QDZ42278.1 septum formation initiator family protein [Corynebacterium sp. sy039]TSD91228.1 septum formation initiator family protein [Corynebacterium sp. SY003]